MIAASIFDLPELIPDREILEILAQSHSIFPTLSHLLYRTYFIRPVT